MRSDPRVKGWWLHGKYFGYPNCCINALLKGEQQKDSVFSGTGFLPCASCNNKDPFEIMDIINTNRICPNKFKPFVSIKPFRKSDFEKAVAVSSMIWEASNKLEVNYDR